MRNTNFKEMEKYFWDNYEGDYDNLKHACEDVVNEAMPVMNYPSNLQRFPNIVDRLADHFRGLPSPFYPEYSNYEIEQYLRKWGIIKENDIPLKVGRLVDGWWYYWANWVIKTSRGERV